MARGTEPRIRLDYTGCLADRVGPAGFTPDQIRAAARAAQSARTRLRATVDAGRYGFDAILDDTRLMVASEREGRRLARLADTLVVDGIGGSALGAIALQSARRPKRRRLVVFDNIDPESVSQRLSELRPERTAVCVVTKSGSTAETMANLMVLLDWMHRKLGARHLRRWCAVTDPNRGDLLKLARSLKISVLPVPENVGGRFSVLTPVGLVPAAFLGLDLRRLLAGAKSMREHCWSAPPDKNVGILGAVLLHRFATERGRAIQVLMPYADGLVPLADWYRQLWAESLGKRLNRRGVVVHTGQTPVTALGATDQHSQVQLYVEGPQDKVISFIDVEKFRREVRIPSSHGDLASTGYLRRRTLGELLRAERRGTEIALTRAGRPNFTYIVSALSEHTLGQLLYLFEFQTALSGELYDIDAFDQPGVEAGKVAAYALMGRKGYEEEAERLEREWSRPRAII